MKFQLFAVVALVGGALVGCKVTTTDDGTGGAGGGAGGAGGGEGGSGNVTTGSTTSGPTTTATTTSNGTTTGGLACDTGEMAAGDSPVCDDCVNCALADQCSDELATFQGTPGAQEWVSCVFGDMGMGGCPDDDMATADVNEFQVCLDACNMASPGVEEAYLGVLGCAICVECPNNCDAASVCTGG